MHSRGNSITNKSASSPKDSAALPQTPTTSSSILDPSNSAAFSNLLPLGNLPTSQSLTSGGHGPISGIHKLPPRPRPGRKADPNPAATKKGQSNRLAQQKHRLKKKQLELQEIERQRKQIEENNRLLRQNAMLMHENKRLKQSHVSTTPPATTTSNPLSPALTSSTSPNPMSVATSLSPPPTAFQSPARPAPGGCGRCVEGGECPCVDSLLETEELDDSMNVDQSTTQKRPSPRHKRPSLSIQSLLSPATEASNPMEVTTPSTQAHHEHEIDFTTAFRLEQNQGTYDPVISTGSLTTCGGCPPDDTSCLCRKANRVAGSPASTTTSSSAAQSRATSTAGNVPGSCARCQADPKQRAWCQGLALDNLGSPISSAASDNNDDDFNDKQMSTSSAVNNGARHPSQYSKRDEARYETISCAEAYSVQQRFAETSISKSSRSSKRKSNTPISAIDVLNSVRERPREYSAFEVDIGTVLSNLKHCSPRRTNSRQ